MRNAYLYHAIRTPVGKRNGGLSSIQPTDLLADTLNGLVDRAGIAASDIEDVVCGCVTQTQEQGVNIARNAVLAAGFPVTVPGTTVNRLCGSSQQALHFAAATVSSGAADLVVAAGVESMTRVPMGSDVGAISERILDRFDAVNQGISAELIAERWRLSRTEIDEFSLESHQKALAAIDEQRFAKEILPVRSNGSEVTTDEGPRRETSMEKLGKLKPAFREDGKITAGNSSQISDGAAAILVGSEEAGQKHGLKAKARLVATAVVGSDPTMMLTGPIAATKKVIARAGLQMSDIDLFEVNEAFSPVVLAWLKETGADRNKLNVNGGAIALGHPLGATGARIVTTLLHELERRQGRYGLVTMCIGFGQATASIIERI